MKSHLNIRVHGRVQGVFFRDRTEKTARAFHIAGFVRNEPDGSVYIEAEGSKEDLAEFLKWCRQGSSQAEVDHLEVEEAEIQNFPDFSVIW